MTYKKHIFPTFLEKLTVSVFAIVLILFLIISFTLIVLRRMNKISVMEVIHGQGKGEDFEKINKFYIHKSKMPIPLYLALSDVRYQLKKYIFLMGAYVCAFLIILCTTNLRDSVYDESFMRYTLSYQFDFHPNFNEELSEYYWGKAGDSTHMLMLINEDIEKAGIPAGFEFAINTNANLYRQDGTQAAIDLMSEFDANKYIYREGEAPRLKNEIALSYATAKRSGFQIGDTVKIKYEDCTDVMATRKEIEEEFIITAFIDYMEGFSNAIAIMSNEFHNGMGNSSFIINIAIRAPEEEKPYYFAKLEELFGAENIDTLEELMEQDMGQYDLILSSIRNLLSATALLVIMLITLLYGRILLSAETTEIAALKSTGFTDAAIKRWQFCRGVLLLLFSTVIAYAVHFTLGQGFVSVAFGALDLTGFHYVIDPIKTFFVVPVMIWISVLLVLWIVQKNINKIKIWKIRED